MKMLKYVFAMPTFLNLAMLISIGSIAFMEIYLLNNPKISFWGEEIGSIYYKLCLSIISSYIFYFIVIHIKSQNDKENLNVFISGKVRSVIDCYKSQISAFKNATSVDSEQYYLSEEDILYIFKNIDPKANAPLVFNRIGNYANWLQFMHYYNCRTQKYIQKIFIKIQFLDSYLIKLLAEIDDCSHFYAIDFTSNILHGNENMGPWTQFFYKYSVLCCKLEEYAEKNF